MTEIRYEQANPVPGRVLKVPSPDLFIHYMHRSFGRFPIELNKNHIERLIGLGATFSEPNPCRELINAIEQLGSIRVWADYGEHS